MSRSTQRSAGPDSAPASSDANRERVLIRLAGESDAPALEWLRQRDTAMLPPPPHIVAEVDGSIRAARSLRTGETVADPFTHTAHLRHMLATRASRFETRASRFEVQPRRALALRWRRSWARGEAW